jgi:hypothetical protein
MLARVHRPLLRLIILLAVLRGCVALTAWTKGRLGIIRVWLEALLGPLVAMPICVRWGRVTWGLGRISLVRVLTMVSRMRLRCLRISSMMRLMLIGELVGTKWRLSLHWATIPRWRRISCYYRITFLLGWSEKKSICKHDM